jgi:RNA polymerase sigma-70 factor (ECF subfamily)
MEHTPVTLLHRLRNQEPGAWERFIELFTSLLDRWAHRLGLNDNDAADLVQDVFLILLRRLPNFEYDATRSFRAWLRTVLVNRWKARSAHYSMPLNEHAANGDFTSELAEAEDRAHLVAMALRIMRSDFEPRVWQAFWAVTVEGRTPQSVAEELGMSVNSVYLARSRILARLREELAGLWP